MDRPASSIEQPSRDHPAGLDREVARTHAEDLAHTIRTRVEGAAAVYLATMALVWIFEIEAHPERNLAYGVVYGLTALTWTVTAILVRRSRSASPVPMILMANVALLCVLLTSYEIAAKGESDVLALTLLYVIVGAMVLFPWGGKRQGILVAAATLSYGAGIACGVTGDIPTEILLVGLFSIGILTIAGAELLYGYRAGSLRQAIQLQHSNEELRESEERFRLLTENARDIIFRYRLIEPRGMEYISPSVRSVTGFTPEELYADEKSFRGLLHPDDEDKYHQALAVMDDLAHGIEVRWRRKDGSTYWAEIRLASVRDEDGNLIGVQGISRDISERKAVEQRLRLQASALDAAANAIVMTDRNGVIRWVNPAFCRLTGYRADEVIGQNPRILKSGLQDEGFYRKFWETILAGDVWSGEMTNRRRDGTLYTEEMNVTPVRDEHGEISHFVAIKQDISARKQVERELRAAKEDAEAANRAKSDFLAVMSHEIRTPMNAVIGMTSLLLDSDLTDEQREYASTVRQSGEMLLDIINDILDFSKIEAGRLELHSADFDLPRLTEELIAVLAGKAQEKGVDVGLCVESDVPRLVCGDPGRLRQILVNLIGNAIKFTDSGEVVTRIAVVDSADGDLILRFEVRDTGPGIRAEDCIRLFEPFSQVDTSTTRRHGGTGLGLAISKRLVTTLGGEIGVESRPGAGSTFWFTAHLRTAETTEDARAQEPATHQMPRASGRMRILVVEDNAVNQRVAVRMLEKLGYRADIAANGREALDAIGRHRYDLVLMDCQMPEMDGFEACRRIRESEASGSRLPIVAMTANALQGDRERCLQAGMDDYLPKPVTATALKKAIDAWAREENGAPPAEVQRRWAT